MDRSTRSSRRCLPTFNPAAESRHQTSTTEAQRTQGEKMLGKQISRIPVLASIQPVVDGARLVSFHPDPIPAAVDRWGHLLEANSAWIHPCHFFDGTKETVRWIFVLDVLNHCFWPSPGEPVWTVRYQGRDYSGYWGLAACLKRAQEAGIPITDAACQASIGPEDLRAVFAGRGRIPMFTERLTHLREAGRILRDDWQGDVTNLVEAASNSAAELLRLITGAFPSFRDEALYHGHRVVFWKRAQIFVADLALAFSGRKWGRFTDIDCLSAFADYKLPQVLRHLGILRYHPDLAARVDAMTRMEPGCDDEVEIRAMTLHAVERIKEVFHRRGRVVNSARVDNWLWQLGQQDRFRSKPYHRCRTIFY